MKKILYIMCALFALTSCQKTEFPTIESGQNPDGSYTFNLGIEEPDYVPKTKAAVVMGRYMLEMYEGDLTATPVKMRNITGVFNVDMKKGVDYVCLFWADGGEAAYDATELTAVKQTTETARGTAAYCASVTVNSKTFDGAVTLKRAVAELSFIDKNGLTEATNSLKITCPYASATLNVGDGTVTHATGTAVRTIANIAPPAEATTAFTTDFVLAPTEAGTIAGLKFQLNEEAEKTITETAIQANYKTKITGEYQPKPATPPVVGDFYMSDGTWLPGATVLTAEQQAACIGIVFVVNPDGTTGKIVSLDEATGKTWSVEIIETGATSNTDGAANTAKVLALSSYSETVYPAFAWCAAKNSPTIDGINWYIPANLELGNGIYPNKATLNTSLQAAGATQLSDNYYWSSTEYNYYSAWYVDFGNGNSHNYNKGNVNSVRVVSAF